MTKLLVVCLGVILSLPVSETFSLADRIGGPDAPLTFFRFSTNIGRYIIRRDGMGEISSNGRRRAFYLKLARKGHIERVYFLEHEGYLLLRYDVIGQGSYLMKMDQRQRRPLWFTALGEIDAPEQVPVINGDVVIAGENIEISKSNGKIVRQD